MFGRKTEKGAASFADELRQKAAAAPERKRREEAAEAATKKSEAIERLYQKCRKWAREEADAGKYVASTATGFTPGQVRVEDWAILNAVIRKLSSEDKLKVTTENVVTNHYSDDTGEDFTRDHLVITMTW